MRHEFDRPSLDGDGARRSDPDRVVAALRGRFEHQGLDVQVVETHISWVLLAGDLAYKIKKPVRLGFLDCTTLEARRHFCDEELRLNRRLAAPLYLDVVAIRGTVDGPSFDGEGPVIEYAVKMHRLPPYSLGSDLLAKGSLDREHLAWFARHLHAFHRDAPATPHGAAHGTPDVVSSAALRALDSLEPLAPPHACESLRRWLGEQSAKLAPAWRQRLADGHVREGHGDLHLDNLVLLDGTLTAFDCIEFDPALRWIDVMSDVAFLVMDLLAHDRRDLAFGFLADYLEHSGDYEGVVVLRFYIVYRALVRAMVAALREQAGVAGGGLGPAQYLQCAQHLAGAGNARLLITHGLPGSGKSHVSRRMLEAAGAIRLRSDVERKRLTEPADRYGPEATEKTYTRVAELARLALGAGFPTIVDAAFLRHAERERMRQLAEEMQVPFDILDCRAPMNVLRERVLRRAEQGSDASEADVAVLEHLAAAQQVLDDRERSLAMEVQAGEPKEIATLVERWLSHRRPVP